LGEFLARVTGLDEFSPQVRLFSFGKFLKITEVAPKIWGDIFFHSNKYAIILTKCGWATFWAIF
jgi:hypothetical protein